MGMLTVLTALMVAAAAADTPQQDALQLFKQQKYNEAIAALETAAKDEKPGSEEYRQSALLIARSYFMLRQAPKAIPWLEKLTEVKDRKSVV